MAFPYVSDVLNFYLGPSLDLPIATFGTFVALAILIATRIATHEVARLQTNGAFHFTNSFLASDIVSRLAFIGFLAGVLGAKLFDAIEHTEELVADPRSPIVDALSTMVTNGTQVKIYAWYDNEWGYSNRTVELTKLVGLAE